MASNWRKIVVDTQRGATPLWNYKSVCPLGVLQLALARGLTMSMTEVDHCAENALAERMNGILKGEYA